MHIFYYKNIVAHVCKWKPLGVANIIYYIKVEIVEKIEDERAIATCLTCELF